MAAICQDTGSKHWSNNGEHFGKHRSNRNPGALTRECDTSKESGYILNPTLGKSSCFDLCRHTQFISLQCFPSLPRANNSIPATPWLGPWGLSWFSAQLWDNVTGSANILCLLENGEHSFLPTTKPCSLPQACQHLGKAFGKRADASKLGCCSPSSHESVPSFRRLSPFLTDLTFKVSSSRSCIPNSTSTSKKG